MVTDDYNYDYFGNVNVYNIHQYDDVYDEGIDPFESFLNTHKVY